MVIFLSNFSRPEPHEKTAKNRFTQESISIALSKAKGRIPVSEACRKMRTSGQSLFQWKRKYEGTGIAWFCRLRQLEEGNIKRVADLALDNHTSRRYSQKKVLG